MQTYVQYDDRYYVFLIGKALRDQRIQYPLPQDDNTNLTKDLQQDKEGAYKPAYKNISETAENKTQIDTRKLPVELAELVTIWHKLPEHIKAAIKALIQPHCKGIK